MKHQYQAFGIPILSEIELPALIPLQANRLEYLPIIVYLGKVNDDLSEPAIDISSITKINENELRYEIPDLLKMYISSGTSILVEPLTSDISKILIYIYARGIAAALMQRNLLPFHVSGILINNKVVLFAAPSGVGKSTKAIKLKERGYRLFTDDTALLSVENGVCYAVASYPMTRLWDSTLQNQCIYSNVGKESLSYQNNKYGFDFHKDFIHEKKEVAALVFLEKKGRSIKITNLEKTDLFQSLIPNIYSENWLDGMKKQKVRFTQLSQISNSVKGFKAIRPINKLTFNHFADEVENKILKIL